MGNIRHKFVKRVAIELVKNYPNEFGDDFYLNREKVLELTDMSVVTGTEVKIPYKKTLNRISGYVTRYAKRQSRKM